MYIKVCFLKCPVTKGMFLCKYMREVVQEEKVSCKGLLGMYERATLLFCNGVSKGDEKGSLSKKMSIFGLVWVFRGGKYM